MQGHETAPRSERVKPSKKEFPHPIKPTGIEFDKRADKFKFKVDKVSLLMILITVVAVIFIMSQHLAELVEIVKAFTKT